VTAPDDRVPATVVTGYLGAGKTTLLNHVLKWDGGRYAVIVNEFGDVGIDGPAVERWLEEVLTLRCGHPSDEGGFLRSRATSGASSSSRST
jgi:adenylate kinase